MSGRYYLIRKFVFSRIDYTYHQSFLLFLLEIPTDFLLPLVAVVFKLLFCHPFDMKIRLVHELDEEFIMSPWSNNWCLLARMLSILPHLIICAD